MTRTSHRESRVVAIAAELLFGLVADVERYPEFIPLMREARIIQRHDRGYETEQVLALGLLQRRFRTRTELDPPRVITVTSADRIFRRFDIRWVFTPTLEGPCRIDFALDCEVRSIWLKPISDVLVGPMALTMVNAFVQRARKIASAPPPDSLTG
ncbi:MAG: type II toxin-antitoxin system RatA family toxin [Candidatus Contendobacter sp.]|nr:type II toxin-antitoxin system RatA family toxin [Candidatus Contendobacter sp.]